MRSGSLSVRHLFQLLVMLLAAGSLSRGESSSSNLKDETFQDAQGNAWKTDQNGAIAAVGGDAKAFQSFLRLNKKTASLSHNPDAPAREYESLTAVREQVRWVRHISFDIKRRAALVIDTLSNDGEKPIELQIRHICSALALQTFATNAGNEISTDKVELHKSVSSAFLEYKSGADMRRCGIILGTTNPLICQTTLTAGQKGLEWTHSIPKLDGGKSMSFAYWLASAEGATSTKTRAAVIADFVKDGEFIDLKLPSVAGKIANEPKGFAASTNKSADDSHSAKTSATGEEASSKAPVPPTSPIRANPAPATKVGAATDKQGTRWVISSSGALERGTLPLRRGNMLYVEIDGRSYSFSSSPSRSSSSSSSKSGKSDKPAGQPFEKPEEVKDDASFNFRFPDDVGFEWMRYVRLDQERGGVRFIDVMTNTAKQTHSVRVRCMNEMDISNSDYFQGASTQRGEVINSENSSLTPETSGVMLHLSPEFSPTLPFFIIGNARDQWTGDRRMDGYQLRLEYNGTLEPGKRAVIVHWIGARTPKEKGKPEKAMERFISGTRLIDAGVPAEWQADVINYPKEAFAQPVAPVASTGVPLVMLDELCMRLDLKRDDKDHLVLDGGSKVEGEFKAAKLTLHRAGLPLPIALDDVAAICGGAGQGREPRLYLRDGSVIHGGLELTDAKFIGSGVGEVKIETASLAELVLHRSEEADGRTTKVAAAARTAAGELVYLSVLPSGNLPLRLPGGLLSVPWSDVATIRERMNPDPGFLVTLKDGSRVNCLPDLSRVSCKLSTGEDWSMSAGLRGFAASLDEVESLVAAEKESDEKPSGGWCETSQGTLWTGEMAEGNLEMEAAAGLTKIKAGEWKSIRRVANAANVPGGATFEAELTSGTKLQGRFVGSKLKWQRGSQDIEIPWTQVIEIKAEEKK